MRGNALRARAAACLPPGAMLRVDLRDALYVTDCEGARAALSAAGFTARARGALTEIRPSRALLPSLAAEFQGVGGDDTLLAQLDRLSGREVSAQELQLLTEALKLLEPGGVRDGQFEKKLRQAAAVCLRSGGGGALGLCRRIQIFAEEGHV